METFDIEAFTDEKWLKIIDKDTGIERLPTRKELVDACKSGDTVYHICAMIYTKGNTYELHLGTDDEARKKFLLGMPKGTYVTWNGAKYDNHGIIHLLHKYGIPYEYMYQKPSSMLSLSFVNGTGEKVVFKDYCKIFATSLAKLLQELVPDMPKLVDTYDYRKIRHNIEDFSLEDIEYIKADVIGLKKAVKLLNKEIQNLDMQPSRISTAGSLATGYMKYRLKEMFWNPDDMFIMPQPVVDYSFITGGMVFVNPETRFKTLKHIGHYDVVSFYPYTMTLDLPYGDPIEHDIVNADKILDIVRNDNEYLYFLKTKCKGIYKGEYSPILSKNDKGINQPLNAFDDNMTISIADPILRNSRLVLTGGTVEYVKYKKYPYLKPIMEEIVALKSDAKAKGETARALMFKIIANSLSGKFMQKPIATEYVFQYNDEVIEEETEPEIPWHVYLPTGSILTAYARNLLCELINELGTDFLYCDTDSVFFKNTKKAQNAIQQSSFALGEELGNLSVKDFTIYDEAAFLGKKCYLTIKDGKKKAVIAGLHKFKFDTVSKGVEDLLNNVPTPTLQGFRTPQGIVLSDTMKSKIFKKEPTFE